VSTKEIAARYATEIHRVVVGQDETVNLSFIALLLRGRANVVEAFVNRF